MGGAACKKCYTDKCLPAFYTCSGYPKQADSDAATGQCTSAKDMELGADLAKDIPACMESSKTATEFVQCIQKDGFSAGCADCVGTYAGCVVDKCVTQCKADPTGAACKTCYTDKCLPAFYTCTGFPKEADSEAATGQCTSAQDMSLAANLEKDIPACMHQSQTAAGIAACIEKDGFTAGCAQCVGTYGVCVIDKCGTQCEADPTGAACKTCYTDKCEPAFFTCTGFPQPSHVAFSVKKLSSQERLVMRMMR